MPVLKGRVALVIRLASSYAYWMTFESQPVVLLPNDDTRSLLCRRLWDRPPRVPAPKVGVRQRSRDEEPRSRPDEESPLAKKCEVNEPATKKHDDEHRPFLRHSGYLAGEGLASIPPSI